MGCVSSKLVLKSVNEEDTDDDDVVVFKFKKNSDDLPNHIVSLTSSTYGALNLKQVPIPNNNNNINKCPEVSPQPPLEAEAEVINKCGEVSPPAPPLLEAEAEVINKCGEVSPPAPPPLEAEVINKCGEVSPPAPPPLEAEAEVINTWELMSDLEEELEIPAWEKSNKASGRSPFRRLTSAFASPKGPRTKVQGKENRPSPAHQCFNTPTARVFRPWKFSTNSNDKLRKGSSSLESQSQSQSPRRSTSGPSLSSRRRRSLGPLFDPDLIHSFEKELSLQQQQEEHIKKMLENYEEKCPPGGENCVVIYTTTLRGIRKTFEDCNVVRAIIESYHIRVIERDISMDSGFKEELRKLMGGKKQVKVPAVFVKGRLIGGADEVVRLNEDGKLQGLLNGIPKAGLGCQGCGGIRFVMCMACNGSCKVVLDQHDRSVVKCEECNENGLIRCPFCCSSST